MMIEIDFGHLLNYSDIRFLFSFLEKQSKQPYKINNFPEEAAGLIWEKNWLNSFVNYLI